MPPPVRVVTLLTDFGLSDHYVAAMKAVMLNINQNLTLVDISHLVPPQDIQTAAFLLGHTYHYFPIASIHLAVVDPGVGTARKAIVASAGGRYFVAPDNGILSYVFEREEEVIVHEVTADHYFLKPVSSTFHGRDIFAPVAAWLSRDVGLHQFGPQLHKPAHLPRSAPARVRDNLIQATVQAVDHFGNLITNLKPEDLPVYSAQGDHSCKILAAQREIATFRRTYGDGKSGELFVIPGSTGYLEIVVRNGSAAALLGLKPGAAIGVVLG